MQNRDMTAESFSDVMPLDEAPLFPGQYAPLDVALFNPGGLP